MADETIRDYLSKLGRKGAEATNNKLTPAQRKKSARRAAEARWAKQKAELEEITTGITEGTKRLEAKIAARAKAKKQG